MFDTLASFSTVYFILSAILFLLILFEKYLIVFEDNARAAKAARKQKQAHAKNRTIKEVRRNENRGAAKSA